MKPSTALYFVALVPPTTIREEVTAFKAYAAKHFGSQHALHSPPHITLIPPFRWPKDQYLPLATALSHFKFQTADLSIDLLNFSSFPPRVIFVDVTQSTLLRDLQAQLEQHFSQHLNIQPKGPFGFHPHMTVAFRDLTAAVFPRFPHIPRRSPCRVHGQPGSWIPPWPGQRSCVPCPLQRRHRF